MAIGLTQPSNSLKGELLRNGSAEAVPPEFITPLAEGGQEVVKARMRF